MIFSVNNNYSKDFLIDFKWEDYFEDIMMIEWTAEEEY